MNITYIATRGSALALAQANLVLAQCRVLFPERTFELKVIKTTGDKLQTMNLTNPDQQVTKGLFTKELEVALLDGEAALAVHSLKDLPTELPDGLWLAGVSAREDVRDVFIYREDIFPAKGRVADLTSGATVATSSTRRQAQLLSIRPDIKTVPIRGNVGTRLQKLADKPDLDGIILALAGLKRLGYGIGHEGELLGTNVPKGLGATILTLEEMLPCVGQAALGYECRRDDRFAEELSAALNDKATFNAVTAERAFLQAMGGGCLSPVAAYAEADNHQLRIRAVSFRSETMRKTERIGKPTEADALGRAAAQDLT